MNITPWTVYWLTRCDSIKDVAGGFLVAGGILGFSCVMLLPLLLELAQDKNLKLKPLIKWYLIVMAFCSSVLVLCPTQKEAAAIVIIPAIANNEDFQKLGPEIPKLAREWLEQLRPTKVEKEGK